MGIVFAMILSIGIKAVSAVVEIAIQMLITNGAGVSGYGSYAFFVSLIEGAYFVLFSGTVKLNTFYLSDPSASLRGFKKKYTLRFVLPVTAVIVAAFAVMGNPFGMLSGVILCVYYLAFDASSIFFSRGKQLPALLGEYLFGRLLMFAGVFTTIRLDVATGFVLLALYGVQFVGMLLWFVPFKSKLKPGTEEVKVPMRKLLEYQFMDITASLVAYSPTILQFIFGGAFSAGFTGIIAIVRRFINFISGPTAKVFLPEFSRLYKNGERDKLAQTYLMIVRIQMIFIGVIGTVLIGFPHLILNMFSPDLLPYTGIFTGTAICLLLTAGIGPMTGLLQMTESERLCNICQWISIGAMVLVWIIMRHEPLFAVYGLCAQAVVDGVLKYIFVCRWFRKNVIPPLNYLLLWLPVALVRVCTELFGWQYSFLALAVCVVIDLAWNLAFALRDPMIRAAASGAIKKFKK